MHKIKNLGDCYSARKWLAGQKYQMLHISFPLSFSTHHSPAGHHNIPKWASARVSTPLRFARFLVLSLIYESNRTPPFHASSVGCTFSVTMFFLALPVHSHMLQHEARTPGFRSTAGPKTHAHKHTLEAPHTALADPGKQGGRSTWSHNLLPPVRKVAGRHQ